MSLENLQKSLEDAVEKMKTSQRQYQKLVSLSSQLETQLHENKVVQEELNLSREDGKVYKAMGSVLVPQTLQDAKTNVSRRIEYIEGELKRNAAQIESYKQDMNGHREKIGNLEKELQKLILKANPPTAPMVAGT